MRERILVYGAYGYTGELITQQLVKAGQNAILSGRNAEKLKPIAEQYSLESRPFDLDRTPADEIDKALEDVKVVIHSAGPFIHTFKAMSDACIRNGVHYLDITGEWEVFDALAGRDAEAKKADVMLMPGVGFDVVPSDCLAAKLKALLPDATDLQMAFASVGRPSRGTQKTVVESLHKGSAQRKDGTIVHGKSGEDVRKIDFGNGQVWSAASIPWGDIVTAWHTTGIANIKVYMGLPDKAIASMKASNWLRPILALDFVKNFMKSRIDKMPPGPTEQQRNKTQMLMWGQATAPSGKTVTLTMQVPEGYKLTSLTSVAIALEVLKGNYTTGYRTPAGQYGANFIDQFEGVSIQEPVLK